MANFWRGIFGLFKGVYFTPAAAAGGAISSATTTTDGTGIILTFKSDARFVGLGGSNLVVKKNGSTWAIESDLTGHTGDDTPTITLTFGDLTPLAPTDVVTISFARGEFVYVDDSLIYWDDATEIYWDDASELYWNSEGDPVPGAVNFPVTNVVNPDPPPFSPADLPGFITSPVFALMRSANQIWQDAAMTVLALANDDPVYVFIDTFSGIVFTALSNSARGVLSDLGAGKWAILNDGVNDGYTLNQMLGSSPFEIQIAQQTTGWVNFLSGVSGANNVGIGEVGNRLDIYNSVNNPISDLVATDRGSYSVVGFGSDLSTGFFWENGSSIMNIFSPTFLGFTSEGLTNFSDPSVNPINGNVTGFTATSMPLSSDNRALLVTYLQATY